MQLPAPTMERPLEQRYRTTEAPLTPSNPPAAVVYLEGDLANNVKPATKVPAVMGQKNMLLKTPYFQKTDAAGHYVLEHLPSGHFILKAWLNEASPITCR